MKILQISDYYHEGIGHPPNNYCEKLIKRGHEILVYTSTITWIPTLGDYKDVKVKKFRSIRFLGKTIYPGVILKLLIQKNPDVVHSHVVGFFSTFVTGYLKKIKKYPLVVLADFSSGVPEPSLLKKPYEWLFRKIPARMADVITTFTEQEKEELSKRFDIDKEKIEVLPIGIDYEKFSSKPRKDLRKELGLEDKFIILNVSNISPVKNLEMIIKTIPLTKVKNIVFVHIGGVSDYNYKKRSNNIIKKLEIEDKIKFLGHVAHEKIDEYYKMCDIYLHTSYRESYAIPILEAMASGIPVITTKVGIAYDVVKDGETGFIIDDEKDIVEKIELLVGDPELRKRIGRNCKEISKEYDWEIIIDRLEEIYNGVLNVSD